MTLKITQQTEKEIVIGFPSFTKIGSTVYGCLSENNVIAVSYWPSTRNGMISIATASTAYGTGSNIITKDEFFAEYQKAVDSLYDDMEKTFDLCNEMISNNQGEPADPQHEEIMHEQHQQTI